MNSRAYVQHPNPTNSCRTFPAKWQGAGVDVVAVLRENGVGRGDLVALVVAPGTGLALATADGTTCTVATDDPAAVVQSVEDALRPRWVMWSNATAVPLVEAGVRVATSWDIAAVHRLLFGGWHADPARVWAQLHDLALDALPTLRPPDLFSHAAESEGTPDDPVRADGYLRPDWTSGGWSTALEQLAVWGALAVRVAELQQARLVAGPDAHRLAMTAHRSRRPSCCARSCRSTGSRSTAVSPNPSSVRWSATAALGGRRGRAAGPARCRSTTARTAGRRVRSPQSRPGEGVARAHRRRASGYPRVEARSAARRASARRRAARVAQGGTGRHDVRLRVARRESRCRRSSARRVVGEPTAPRDG